MIKNCAICKARFKLNKKAKTTETRHFCLKCRKALKDVQSRHSNE